MPEKTTLKYLTFLIKSTNQYGVHSPFVFQYITRGLYYSKKKFKAPKKQRFLLKTIEYFNPKTLWFADAIEGKEQINNIFQIPHQTINPDMVFVKSIHINHKLNYILNNMHNNTIVVVDFRKNQNQEALNMICEHPLITVVMNFYHFVVFSIRKEQKKQVFLLRM